MTHELKCWPEYFNEILNGKKKFEIRKNDRDFKVGDTLVLWEWEYGRYTGHFTVKEISYILQGGQFGIEEGYCVMSLQSEKIEQL